MLNQIVLVGKVKELPVIKETSGGTKLATMLIEVDRSFKNSIGEIDTDEFQVTLWRGIAEECEMVCKIGSLIGVKGRLQANNFAKEESIFYKSEIVAEKISFLN